MQRLLAFDHSDERRHRSFCERRSALKNELVTAAE
jgi:hypothetical protein